MSPKPTPLHGSPEEGVQAQEHISTHISVHFSFGSREHDISPVDFHLLVSFSSYQNCFILISAAGVKVPISKGERKLQPANSRGGAKSSTRDKKNNQRKSMNELLQEASQEGIKAAKYLPTEILGGLQKLPGLCHTKALREEEKEMASHSSILAWRIPWIEEPDDLQSMGSQRVGHD